MVVNWEVIAAVKVGMMVTNTRAIAAAIRVYSIAVAPDSSLRNFLNT